MLPLAEIKPVTYSPVSAKTATLLTPLTDTVTLAPGALMLTFELPLLMLATDVITPVKNAPLPKK